MDSNLNKNKTEKEFLDNVTTINYLNSNLLSENKNFLLSVKITDPDNIITIICTFKILEKEKIWIEYFNFENFVTYKNKMGFDGSWKAFFKTFECAVNKTNGGDLNIKIEKNNIQLFIFHPLSEDLKVKSDIIFEKFYDNTHNEFKNLNFDLMLELYESKEIYKLREDEKMIELNNKEWLRINNNNTNYVKNFTNNISCTNILINAKNKSNSRNNNPISKLELKKNLKRKFNSDLINPNNKKRKTKGTTYVYEDVEYEEDDNINI